MSSQITVTGKAGPGLTVTAVVLTLIRSFSVGVDLTALGNFNILTITMNTGEVKQYDITDATTFTVTKSAGNYTIVVS